MATTFWDMTPKVQATKAKINKWNYIKLQSFYTAEEKINKMKRQPTKGEKIFANRISDKDRYPKYIKNSYNSIAKNLNNPV